MTATKMSMQKYANATLHDLIRLVTAAEDLYCIIAEFTDEPEYWENEMQMFDLAMGSCPGTNARYHKQHAEELIKP